MNTQLALSIQLNDEATLADFSWQGNELLKQQLLDTLAHQTEPLIYLWGNHGAGKSHILQGCCHALSAQHSAIYLPLKQIKELGPEVLAGLEEQDFIGLDDVGDIAGNKPWEEAIFHLYNRVKDKADTTLLITGQHPPAQSKIKLPDLRSRLGWGLIAQIHELSDADKLETLKQLAQKRGFLLSNAVGQFLIARCSRNMHDLLAMLDQLDKASLRAQRKITVPFVKEILRM